MNQSDCNTLNPLQRDGTSQRQRLLTSLHPSYVSIDEREMSDLLMYAKKYATLLQYYNAKNEADGDWVDFIESDISTLIAIIARTDYQTIRSDFQSLLQTVESHDFGLDKLNAFSELFPYILNIAENFNGWYQNAIEGLSLSTALERVIQSNLSTALQEIIAIANRTREVWPAFPSLNIYSFLPIWQLSKENSTVAFFSSGDPLLEENATDIEAASQRVSFLFERFYEAVIFMVTNSPEYLEESLTEYPNHKPHFALLLAFLQLFKYNQTHLNTITESHLNFYYEEVLQLEYKIEESDSVHLVFELAKNVYTHLLKAETSLKAGKDDTSIPLTYTTDEEIILNKTQVTKKGLKSIFIASDSETSSVTNIYAAPIANSQDGQGEEIEDAEGKWPTFGNEEMPFAQIGFAIASPSLYLKEGNRTILLNWTFGLKDGFLHDLTHEELAFELTQNLSFYLSGEEEWLSPEIASFQFYGTNNDGSFNEETIGLQISLNLSNADKPVVQYNPELLEGGFETKFPVLKVELNNEGYAIQDIGLSQWQDLQEFDSETTYAENDCVAYNGKIYKAIETVTEEVPDNSRKWREASFSYPYKYFQYLNLQTLTINVEVTDALDLIIENDIGTLNTAKPFMPFGPQPKFGSYFLVGSQEAFQKQLTSFDLNITWADLPQESFATYYNYHTHTADTRPIDSNEDFLVNAEILNAGDWDGVDTNIPLFTTDLGSVDEAPLETQSIELAIANFEKNSSLQSFNRYTRSLKRGFIRLKLLQDFLHRQYPSFLVKSAIDEVNYGPPNAPYSPIISELKISYQAIEYIDFLSDKKADTETQLFHIYPFGQIEFSPASDAESFEGVLQETLLVPSFNITLEEEDDAQAMAEGTLYIGLEGLIPEQNVSILFQVAEGSAEPDLETPEVQWAYLSNNQWIDFGTTEILEDNTNGLLTSGIIKFVMPDAMTSNNSILPNGYHWIKVSVRTNKDAINQLIAVHTQAVKASFQNNDNDPNHLANPLAATTIKKLKIRQAAIKSVAQPYASFDGKMKEQSDAFYTRISERLRHKNRAVSIFDYERLVLEEFPQVYKVKCLNHTNEECEYAPGYVKVIAVPDLRNRNAVDPFRPRLSANTLEEIQDFLQTLASDFTQIVVDNPTYEQVQVSFNVQFVKGKDKGYYTQLLEEDIQKYLTPWLYDEGADISFGGTLHRSLIINFIEEREYVDFLTDFQMTHITEEQTLENVEEAIASTSSSVLVSASSHIIGHNIESSCQIITS